MCLFNYIPRFVEMVLWKLEIFLRWTDYCALCRCCERGAGDLKEQFTKNYENICKAQREIEIKSKAGAQCLSVKEAIITCAGVAFHHFRFLCSVVSFQSSSGRQTDVPYSAAALCDDQANQDITHAYTQCVSLVRLRTQSNLFTWGYNYSSQS